MAASKVPFKKVLQTDVPHTRKGKHQAIVAKIMRELKTLKSGSALKVPLGEMGSTKEKVRSALNRVTRAATLDVGTAADGEFLYIWKK
jgi:hypothetical protein